jgi:hypothetical protein
VIYRRTALSLSIVLACSALAACSDSPTASGTTAPTEALASAVTTQATSAPLDMATARIEALRDALFRVQPTLLSDDRSTALGVALRQAIEALERKEDASARNALQRVEQTLQRYEQRDNAMSPDVEVIRLAVHAASAR